MVTGPRATLRRAVSFILDPVPRVDRKPKPTMLVEMKLRDNVSKPIADFQRAFYRLAIAIGRPRADWLGPVDWSRLETAAERHPRSSPARLRPYNWEHEHAWPVDGWVVS